MTPPYQPPMDTDPEQGLDAAQALVLCCLGGPTGAATAWLIFKSVQHDKKAEHACYIFFIPLILGILSWILLIIFVLALIPFNLPF